jgi:PAS domain S-box-containing protein
MKKTTDASPSSFNYYEAILNNAIENTILLMDKEGIIITINKAFTSCFGYEEGDLKNKHFSILFTEEDQLKKKPEEELEKVIATGQSSDNNYLVSKDKTVTWVSGESLLIKNDDGEVEVLKLIQNIHKQKVATISLQQLNNFNENILSAIEDLVFVLDEEKNVIKANRAFNALFSFTGHGNEKINFADLIKPFDVFDEIQTNIQKTINTRKPFTNMPIEIGIASGEKRMFDVSCSYLEQVSSGNNILVVMHDITVHKRIEREREDVIGFVAHELRNPLANLVLCNEILNEAIKENNIDEALDMLKRSRNNVSRLNKMIAELYDATKINSGKLRLDVATFNFKEMITEAINTVQVLQPSYNIIVQGDMDLEVSGDRYRLIQVVTNYLSNGIKYSNGKTDVLLSVFHDKTTVTVSVKDEGLGIPKNQLPYIFNRFFRSEKTRNLEGIGLGLYLCRQIIHAHNGKVWVESEEGKGSVFYFSIPL